MQPARKFMKPILMPSTHFSTIRTYCSEFNKIETDIYSRSLLMSVSILSNLEQ